MDYISINKLANNFKIDVYQLKSYIKYLNLEIKEINEIDSISISDLEMLKKFIDIYSRNEISYIISHGVKPFFDGMLLLNLRKKYNLNEKQFKSKISSCGLEFKYVYNNEEVSEFDKFINLNLNKAELRDVKYIKEGWIPLRNIAEKSDISMGTLNSYVKKLGIEIYKPLHQLAFITKKDEEKLFNFINSFSSTKERKLYLQKETCINKYGEMVDNPSQLSTSKKKISDKIKSYASTKEGYSKIINAQKLTNLNWSEDRKLKCIKSKLNKFGTLCINYFYNYDNLKFNSSWELYYYIYQKEILGNNITRGKIFEYEYNNEIHKYECDFLVENENIEIKGNQFFKNGEFIQMKTKEWNKCKFQCMKDNDVKVISKEEIEPIIKIVDEKYTSDYVQLFKKDIPFPYINKDFNDKSDMGIIRHFHKSIYYAKRNKHISPFEAWNDKTLIKKSALNRLKYIGSCKPSDIVQGFNVAKIAPKVSVFNSKLAEKLICKYLNDVKTIFDPFSGFSGRMIGSFRCGKYYVGKDLNEVHVKESNEIIKHINGENLLSVIQEDIFESKITYFDKSALFTCPPYEDKEFWNENDKILTCDEWIDVCLNKYKVNKYLFVVDDTIKYKNNIVEVLENKSHFGKNKEYAILIENYL